MFFHCQGTGADFCFIPESHVCSKDAAFWKGQWGNDVRFSFGTNRSVGIMILQVWGLNIEAEIDYLGQWIILVSEISHTQFILVNSYATNNKLSNYRIFQEIKTNMSQLLIKYSAKIIWGSDFNTTLNDSLDR